jgi:hypothetical protein
LADHHVTEAEGNMHEMKINGERHTYREPDLTEFPPATLADLVYNDAVAEEMFPSKRAALRAGINFGRKTAFEAAMNAACDVREKNDGDPIDYVPAGLLRDEA